MIKSAADFKEIFSELQLANLAPEVLRDPTLPVKVSGVVADSRKLSHDTVFCAIRGTNYDGHDFLQSSNLRVPIAIVEDKSLQLDRIPSASAVIRVNSTRAAWAQLASFFCGHPARDLILIGITGTNGKTSTTWMIGEILQALSKSCATIGTLGIRSAVTHLETAHTTPDPDLLFPALKTLSLAGVKYVAMEASSHSLAQGKLWPIRFAAAGFTSFSQDHLDFHKDMDEYLRAKLILFEKLLQKDAHVLIHADLRSHDKINELIQKSKTFNTYGQTASTADFVVSSTMHRLIGQSQVQIRSVNENARFHIPMIGDIFAENFSLALILVTKLLDLKLSEVAEILAQKKIRPVPGRLQLIKNTTPRPWRPLVYVDYAHTPDALQKALLNLSTSNSKPAVIFGCGGDRDRSKRPLMGQIAACHASKVIVTSDNPRTEDPSMIIKEIVAGIDASDSPKGHSPPSVQVIVDRKEAIDKSIAALHGRDCLLVAGKGHEDYQIIGQNKVPFSDQEEVSISIEKERTWLIFGAGISGFAAAEHLTHFGDKVYICADGSIDVPRNLHGLITPCNKEDIPWQSVGGVVASPGVPPWHPILQKAAGLRLPVISEIDIGLDGFPGKTLAVTGTNGKSTTVAMAEFIGRRLNLNLSACGNIGKPPSSLNLRTADVETGIVIELSSYQLEGSQIWPAETAAITSFSPDHLARHKTMDNYFSAKWRITEWLKPGGTLLLSSDVAKHALTRNVQWPSSRIVVIGLDASKQKIPANFEAIDIVDGRCMGMGLNASLLDQGLFGLHNQTNALFSAVMLNAVYGAEYEACLHLLKGFKGLPFRCETIFDNQQIRIVNDSKSTNLESTVSALSMMNRPVILLMGGQGKGEPYHPLFFSRDKIQHFITFGASGPQIASETASFIKAEVFEKMAPAVLRALGLARDNRCDILFSPGCASFDEFKNFENRGEIFNQIVNVELKDLK